MSAKIAAMVLILHGSFGIDSYVLRSNSSSPQQATVIHDQAASSRAPDREHEGGTDLHHPGHAPAGEHWAAPETAAKRQNPVSADRLSIERGRNLYQTYCVACHGPQGRGDGPAAAGLSPKPDDLMTMASRHPSGDLAWKIEKGRGSMPAWKGILTDTQIWDLVNFLEELAHNGIKTKQQRDHRHEDGSGH